MKFLKKYGILLWALALVSIYQVLLLKTPLLTNLYSKSLDFFIRYRYDHQPIPKIIDKIIIVDIDEVSLSKIQQRWPIRRDLYAQFLKNITKGDSRPLVVAINIAFFGKSEQPDVDLTLAEALKNNKNIILGTYLDPQGNLVLPESILADAAAATGFVSYPRDRDFIIRRVRPFIIDKSKMNYCLMLNTLLALKGISPQDVIYERKANLLKIASLALPIEPRTYTIKINYFAKFNDFKIIPFWKVLDETNLAGIFKDKIVFLGTTMELLHDMHLTPLGLMPGLAINANFLISLLSNRLPAELPLAVVFFMLFLVALAINFVTYRYNATKGFIFYLLLALIGYYISIFYISKDIAFDFFGLNFIAIISFASIALFKRFYLTVENTRLNKLAITDPLSGLYVARYFELKLNSETRIAKEVRLDLSLVIFEIDKFQEFNNAYSYELGNDILREVASSIKRSSRPSDVVSRLEGTKFAVILTRTKLEGGRLYAEKIRKIIEALEFTWQDKQVKITVSAGVSSLNAGVATVEDLLSATVRALHEAADHGSNRVKTSPA